MIQQVIQDFHRKLSALATDDSEVLKRANAGINLSIETLSRLREIIEKEDFENTAEEINFFKNIKPIPMSYLIYFAEIRSFEMRKPIAGAEFKEQFYENELQKINEFFQENSEFCHYMELKQDYVDRNLFTRDHWNNFPLRPITDYYQYPEFSTSHGMLWSKIQAMLRFVQYVKQARRRAKPNLNSLNAQKTDQLLVWSGPKTALVEIIYALQAAGYINHGAADISKLASYVENAFGIKLNAYKTFTEIKARKGERTKYLNNLTRALEDKMNRDDEKGVS